MKMFMWLRAELLAIQTPKFHLVTTCSDLLLHDAVTRSPLRLPNEYKEFVVSFGNCRLFRKSLLGYRLGVLAGPVKHPEHESLFKVGFCDSKVIYLCENTDNVFANTFKKPIAKSFDSWLKASYQAIKAEYGFKKWGIIESGPKPFNDVEVSVVEARDQYNWQVVGQNEIGHKLLEIENNSQIIIPCLTIGVQSTDKHLNGAITIDIKHLSPGEKKVFAVDCYKEYYHPDKTELYNLPKPGPEDREFLEELKRLAAKT